MPSQVLRDSELPKNYDPYILLLLNYRIVVILMVVLMLLFLRINIFLNIVVLVGLKDLLLLLPIV